MLLKAITGSGKKAAGLQNRPANYNEMYPPPFFGTGQDSKKCNCIYSKKAPKRTLKKKAKKKDNKKKSYKKRQGIVTRAKLSIQPNTTFRSSIVRPKFLKNTPISNFEILKWIKYFAIKNFKVISRDEIKNIKDNNSYIVNLDDTSGPGSHWVGLHFSKKIFYFDCFGLAPPQELIELGIEYVYNSTQYQYLYSTTCGYFSLYFINEIRKRSFVDVVKPFKHGDTLYNENFIEYYFKNI